MNEILFSGWSIFAIFNIPILLVLNASITFSVALWINIHPEYPVRKYLLAFLILLVISIICSVITSILMLNDPNFASRIFVWQAVFEGWLRWIMLMVLFGIIPYGGTSLILWFITRSPNPVFRKHLLFILPAANIVLTVCSSIIYIALAIGLDATPD
jgi:hypothetical protein